MTDLTQYKIRDQRQPYANNHQWVYKFPNRYGASVVQGPYTYGGPQGLYELAVLEFKSDDPNKDDGDITYDTPITDDVIGHLSLSEVEELLQRIYDLPAPTNTQGDN